jgi:stress response protein YsnF
MSPGVCGCVRTEGIEKETIQETVRREDVEVDESGKTARREKGINEEKL